MENGLSKSVVKDSNTSKTSLGKIIGIMFMSRTYAHMAHLATPSYAAHVALNGFFKFSYPFPFIIIPFFISFSYIKRMF